MNERYKSYGFKGKKHSPETIEKMRESHRKNPTKYWLGKKRLNDPRKGSKLTEEHKKRISESMKGDKGPNWKGGVTAEHLIIRNSVKYKDWRKSVFRRDGWTCIICSYRSKSSRPPDIHADHIKPFFSHPELRFDINNGRTLCVPCHMKTETWGRRTK